MKILFAVLSLVSVMASVSQADEWQGERAYLDCNIDVERALRRGQISSAYEHWREHGRYEGRITDGRCYASDAPRWFDERGYLYCHDDVRRAVERGGFRSGWHHYRANGRNEGRRWDCRR